MESPTTPPSIYKSVDGYDAIMEWYEHQVERCSVHTESRWLETHAGRTHLLVAGPTNAPPVLLLHGMNLNAAAMTTGIRFLASTRWVYAVDVIGMPGKSPGTRPSRSGDDYPRWLDDALSTLNVDQACLIGQSFGGWIILKWAAIVPNEPAVWCCSTPADSFRSRSGGKHAQESLRSGTCSGQRKAI